MNVLLRGPLSLLPVLPMVISSNPCHGAESILGTVDDGTNKEQHLELGKTYNLKSGILFRDVRIGKGPLVTASEESSGSSDT